MLELATFTQACTETAKMFCFLQMDDMSHWDTSGDWKVQGSGYQTEKAFATSFMDCTKHQVVDLTELFSAEYLDSAPDIQVTTVSYSRCSLDSFRACMICTSYTCLWLVSFSFN